MKLSTSDYLREAQRLDEQHGADAQLSLLIQTPGGRDIRCPGTALPPHLPFGDHEVAVYNGEDIIYGPVIVTKPQPRRDAARKPQVLPPESDARAALAADDVDAVRNLRAEAQEERETARQLLRNAEQTGVDMLMRAYKGVDELRSVQEQKRESFYERKISEKESETERLRREREEERERRHQLEIENMRLQLEPQRGAAPVIVEGILTVVDRLLPRVDQFLGLQAEAIELAKRQQQPAPGSPANPD